MTDDTKQPETTYLACLREIDRLTAEVERLKSENTRQRIKLELIRNRVLEAKGAK